MQYLLFVDDTSFNHNKKSAHLNQEEISMVGCLVPIVELPAMAEDLCDLLADLREKYNCTEFHFTDIFNQKNQFENITGDDAIAMMRSFVDIIRRYNVEIITQTVTQEILKNTDFIEGLNKVLRESIFKLTPAEEKSRLNQNKNSGKQVQKSTSILKEFGVDNRQLNEAYGLILNIFMAKKYLSEKSKNHLLKAVFCDAGLKKPGTEAKLFSLYPDDPTKAYHIDLNFEDSASQPFLQLADFSAWALSRTKQTLDNSIETEMKPFQQTILSDLSTIAGNYVNLQRVRTNTSHGINYDKAYDAMVKKRDNPTRPKK